MAVIYQPLGSQDNPNPGRGSFATTDANGRYTLKYDGERPGAVIGKHRVAITSNVETSSNFNPETGSPDGEVPQTKGGERIPARYNEKTDLTFDVPAGGTDKADFRLTSR